MILRAIYILKLIFCKLYTLKLLSGRYEDGRGVGGHGVHSLHGYIRNTPSDTHVHAEHQLRVDRST